MKAGRLSDAKAKEARNSLTELLQERPDAKVIVTNDYAVDPQKAPEWLSDLCTIDTGEAPLYLVAEVDHGFAIELFLKARATGYANGLVGMREDPGRAYREHIFEIESNGDDRVFAIVWVTDDSEDLPDRTRETNEVMPRRIVQKLNEVGVIQSVDESAFVLMGWTDDLIGTSAVDLIHPDDREGAVERWVDMLGGEGFSCRGRAQYQTADGEWKWFEVTTTNRFETEGICVSEMFDVTSEMHLLSQLRRREEILLRLTDALPGGVAHFGHDGQVVFTNDRLFEITGFNGDQIVDFRHLFDPSLHELMTTLCVAALDDGPDENLEVALKHPSGKPCFVRLAFRSLGEGGFLVSVDDITDSWLMRQELSIQAATDSLTGVANRHALLAALESALADRRSSGAAVVYLDLNGFKTINDTLGHAVGDDVLRQTATRLVETARDSDVVGRIGGDEFVVVCPDLDPEAATLVADRLGASVNQPVMIGDTEIEVSAACGFRVITADDDIDADRLLGEADQAMYLHKRAGGPRPINYDQLAAEQLPEAS